MPDFPVATFADFTAYLPRRLGLDDGIEATWLRVAAAELVVGGGGWPQPTKKLTEAATTAHTGAQ